MMRHIERTALQRTDAPNGVNFTRSAGAFTSSRFAIGNLGCSSKNDAKAAVPISIQETARPLRNQAAQEAAAASFQKLDANRDGYLDRKEMQHVFAGMPPQDARAAFDTMDQDHDGRISLREYEKFFYPICFDPATEPTIPTAEVPPEPGKVMLGISAAYVLDVYPDLAREYLARFGPAETQYLQNPNFYDMSKVLACGPNGLGKGKICPRDGKPDCSIVDAVSQPHNGKATHFVSWCWAYKLNDFVSAIRAWTQRENMPASDVYLWVCFFCNNQYRILGSGARTGADELKDVFESHLAEAGHMLLMMDKFVEPAYVTRAWCIFETFVCIAKQLPMTIILPERAEGSFSEIMNSSGGFSKLRRAFEDLDVRYARASEKTDEDLIKRLILQSTTGFDAVNDAVKKCLLEWLTIYFKKHLLSGGSGNG